MSTAPTANSSARAASVVVNTFVEPTESNHSTLIHSREARTTSSTTPTTMAIVGTSGLRRRGATTGRARRSGRRPLHGGSKLTGSLSPDGRGGCTPRSPNLPALPVVPTGRPQPTRTSPQPTSEPTGTRPVPHTVRHDGPVTDAITRAVLETEHHVAENGWDQPPR